MELTQLKLDIYANKLLMLAGICCVLLFLNINIFDIISESISPFITNIILLLITLAVFHQLFNRNYYLQFLGNTVYPCSNLTEKTPNHQLGHNRPAHIYIYYILLYVIYSLFYRL